MVLFLTARCVGLVSNTRLNLKAFRLRRVFETSVGYESSRELTMSSVEGEGDRQGAIVGN